MKKLSILFVIIAASLWGVNGFFVRTFIELGFTSYQLVMIKSLFTAVVLLIVMAIKDKKLLYVKLKDLVLFIIAAIISVALFSCCYFNAMNMISLSLAAVLLYTAPIFVMILSTFIFKEKFTVKKLICLVLAFLGCVLVSGVIGEDTGVNWKGILLGLAAGITYGLYSIFSKTAINRNYAPITFTAYTFLIGGLVMLPFSNLNTIGTVLFQDWYVPFYLMGFALVANLIPYLLYSTGLKNMEASKASITATVEPVVATLVGVIVYKEVLGVVAIIGIILVLGSSILLNITFKKKDKINSEEDNINVG